MSKRPETGEKGRDGFVVDPSPPDYRWQQLFSEFLKPLPRPIFQIGTKIQFAEHPPVKTILAASPDEQIEAIEALVCRRLTLERQFAKVGSRGADESDCVKALGKLTIFLLNRKRPYTPVQGASLLSMYLPARDRRFLWDDAPALLKICQDLAADGQMSPELREAIKKFAARLHPANDPEDDWEGAPERRAREGFEALI
jgi:hypothetical protein